MAERGLAVDPVTIWRWVQHFAPLLNQRLRRELGRPNGSWRVDETYIVEGVIKMIPAVGQTVIVRGPARIARPGRIVSAYHSTGGFLSVWIDLDDWLSRPANQAALACHAYWCLRKSGSVS
jgi:hypothetical protein